MNRLKKIFAPPVFKDEVKTQQAYLLNIILWVLICVPVPFVMYTLFFTPERMNRTLAQTVFGETVNLTLLVMLHRGHVRAASIIQVVAFWFFFTVTAITGTGVQSEAYLLGYGLVIAIAGIVLGGRGALFITILSLLTGMGMVYASQQGMLTTGFTTSALSTWIVSFVLFPVSATLQYLGTRITQQALERARASEERYRLISEASSDYTFSTKLNAQGDMYLNWVDGAFERMTGYNYKEYVASGGWHGHLHLEDVEGDNQALVTLMANQSTISEVRTFKKDREVIWVRVYAHPVWDEKQNRLVGIVGAVQDITERKQAEEALRRSESIYRRAIEVAGAVPYHETFDREGKVIYDFMGEGIREITGYSSDEFSENLWDSLVVERHLLGELEPYSLEEAIQQVRVGNIPIWKCEYCIKARDGNIRWVFEAAVDLRDEHGLAHGSVGLYQDITDQKQSENLLKYERDLLQIFLDNIPDTVYFKDNESRFVRINSAQARMLGVAAAQDAIGKTDLDFMPPELAKSFMEEERKIIQTGEPVLNRIEFNPTHEGQLRWLSATKVPVRDVAGQVTGIIGISRDVTEQKLAQEYEQSRRAILEKVLRLGQEVTEVQDFHTTLKKIWHGIHSELSFDRLGIYLYNPDTNSMDGTFGTNNQGGMIEEWDIHICLDEKTTEVEVFISVLKEIDGLYFTHDYEAEHNVQNLPIMQGVKDFAAVAARVGDKPVAVICVDQAISGRAISDEQLEALRLFAGYVGLAIQNTRLNSALEQDLAHRQTLIEELEAKNAELERFTYTVSHDLKSPLVTITGFLGYVEKDALAGDTDRVKASIERIHKAAQKMQDLLNDLLELSRIGRLMNEPENISFHEIVRDALEHVRGRLEASQVQVEVQDTLPVVRGDKIRLIEVVQNLLDNAAKFTAASSNPLIKIGSKGVNEKNLPIFFVSDNGIGIAPQYHEKIFGLFDKLDPTVEGTGVGLTLVKRIIEVHGGTIWLESQPGSGTTFYFTLPGIHDEE